MKKGQDKEFDQYFKTMLINNESNRKRYDRLKSEGICVRCARNPSLEGYNLCAECLAKANEYQHEYRKVEGELESRAAKRRRIRNERIKYGLCVTCGRKLFDFDSDHRECRICRQKTNRRYKERAKRKKEERAVEGKT